jgi:hypothetical protein
MNLLQFDLKKGGLTVSFWEDIGWLGTSDFVLVLSETVLVIVIEKDLWRTI